MVSKDVELARVAGHHHGVFSVHHAHAAGFSDQEIKRRRESGIWVSQHKGAYRFTGAPALWRGDLLAACWAGGFRAYASHRSAAALWALPGGRRDLIELTCPRWRRARHDGLVVHETKAASLADVVMVSRIPVTSPARTLLDLGAVYGRGMVELALESALARELVSTADLREVLRRVGRSGRNGTGILRALLAMRAPKAVATESSMETRVVQLLRRHGLPDPVRQHVIRHSGRFVARVDLAFPEWKIAIEYDSFEWHLGSAALVRDAARRNAIAAVGWTPITASPADLKGDGSALVRAIIDVAHRSGVDRGV